MYNHPLNVPGSFLFKISFFWFNTPGEESSRETQVGAKDLRGAVLRATTSGDRGGAAAEWELRHPRRFRKRWERWEWKSPEEEESWEQSLW